MILLSFFSAVSFMDSGAGRFFNEWRFQFYLLSLVLFVYALCSRFFLYSFFAVLLLLLNFFVVSSAAPILLSDGGGKKGESLALIFQKETSSFLDVFEAIAAGSADLAAIVNPQDKQVNPAGLIPSGYFLSAGETSGSFMVSAILPTAAGRISLGEGSAVFARVAANGKKYVFLSLSLSKMSYRRQEEALGHINAFITAEDDPVIIFGDFGMTAWNPLFVDFLAKNRLEVKNTLFSRFSSLIMPPTEYVVGYRNMEFVDITSLPAGENRFAPLLFDIKL